MERDDLNGQGRFTIMLDWDAWKKGGSLTAPPLTGYDMYFDSTDEKGDYGNDHLKQKHKVVTPGKMVLTLYKAKTFGVKTEYGAIEILAKPDTDLVMYWPEDCGGDHYNHFQNILGEVKEVTGGVTSIATDLASMAAIAG